MADINSLLQLLQGTAQNVAANQKEVESQVIAKANIGEEMVALNDAKGSKQNDVTAQLLRGQEAAQQASHQYAEMIGGTLDSPKSLLPQLAQTFRENTIRTNELDSKSFFDNPLMWLPNQIEADATEAAATSAFNSMQKINAMVSSGAAAQKSIEQTLTKDSIASALDIQAMQSKFDSLKLRSENSDKFMEGLKAIESGSMRQIELAKAQVDAIHSEESLALQRQHISLTIAAAHKDDEMRAEQLKALKLQNADRVSAQEGAALELKSINLGLTKAGVESTLPEDKSGLVAIGDLKKGAAGQRYIQGAMRIAAAAVAHPDYGPPIYGNTPSEALRTSHDVGAKSPTMPEEVNVIKFVQRTLEELTTADALGHSVISKSDTPDEQAAKLDQAVASKLGVLSANAETPNSFYAAPKLGLFKSAGAVVKTPLYQKVLAPQIATGNGDSSISSVLELGRAAVRSGDISPKDLADGITLMYNTAINYNNFTSNFAGRGLPQQKSYNVVVPNAHGSSVSYDLSKREQVVKMLIAEEVKQALPTTTAQFLNLYATGAKKTFKHITGIFGEK